MEIVIAALVAAGVAVAVVMLVQRPRTVGASASGRPRSTERANLVQATATAPAVAPAPDDPVPVARDALEEELVARRTEIARLEERLRAKESSLQVQEQQLDERDRSLEDRRRNLDHTREELKTEKARQLRELERVSGLSAGQAKQMMMRELEDDVRHESARLTLERLLTDGRIHPARIEEAFHQAKSEIDQHVVEVGEQAVFEANVGSLHPELVKLLGRLKFRTSYGQNVLHHSVECARLAGMLAAELGADPRVAARAALLHDIGKAVSHETEGPHALVGGELARRYKEAEAVAHAMEAHHNEVEPQTVEAVIVQIVDALSGARPGARGESLEQYVKRLHELEAIACRHTGVDKVYAMHAGREIRVIVHPEEIDDDAATLLSHQIARDVEKELEYPGQIKVTVIRESRATDYAK